MASTEERMKILKMIEEGKLSAEEGARLLTALADNRKRNPTPIGGRTASGARWMRVKVTDLTTGRSKATVQIPLQLIESGIKIGAHFAPEVEGVNMDSVMRAMQSGMTGKIVDVVDEKDNEHVEIWVE